MSTTTTQIFHCEPWTNGRDWYWRFYCHGCRSWHYHAPHPGNRMSHCHRHDSPLYEQTYEIRLAPLEVASA